MIDKPEEKTFEIHIIYIPDESKTEVAVVVYTH